MPPAPPASAVEPGRPAVIQSADVFVDSRGLVYVTDVAAGLHVLEFNGA